MTESSAPRLLLPFDLKQGPATPKSLDLEVNVRSTEKERKWHENGGNVLKMKHYETFSRLQET